MAELLAPNAACNPAASRAGPLSGPASKVSSLSDLRDQGNHPSGKVPAYAVTGVNHDHIVLSGLCLPGH